LSRLSELFEETKDREKLLSIFVTAGYPECESTPDLVWRVEEAGADFVEVGFPFSDPMADGPTIQKSSEVALANGVTLPMVLEQIGTIRERSQIPVVLMTYLNPVLAYGLEPLLRDAKSVGVDGFIIPDLIPEEWRRLCGKDSKYQIEANFLISPITPEARIATIDKLTSDFLYCVSVTGVTGARHGMPPGLAEFLKRTSSQTTHPLLVGFGVSKPADARNIAQYCDGVIVGSALISQFEQHATENEAFASITNLVGELKSALKGV
jgi:tryptophan synthase alpha chain